MLNTFPQELLEEIIFLVDHPLPVNRRLWEVSKQACQEFVGCLTLDDVVEIPLRFLPPTVLYFQESAPKSKKKLALDKLRQIVEQFIYEKARTPFRCIILTDYDSDGEPLPDWTEEREKRVQIIACMISWD